MLLPIIFRLFRNKKRRQGRGAAGMAFVGECLQKPKKNGFIPVFWRRWMVLYA